MSVGKKPRPAYLRVADKAHRHRHKDEPMGSDDKPIAPEHLSDRGKAIFAELTERLDEIGVASITDTYAIELYATNQEELEYLDAFLRLNGHTYETVNDIKPRPECKRHKDCKDLKLKLLIEFGLTPSARARVKTTKKENSVGNTWGAFGQPVEEKEAEG